jgi:hypothetical protein
MARIDDASGKVVKSFTDGLTVKVAFARPATSPWLEFEVGDERLRQPVAVIR